MFDLINFNFSKVYIIQCKSIQTNVYKIKYKINRNKLMTQNRFIRPLSTRYRDFTQQKLQQTFQEVPYKFKTQYQHQQYVKKPKYIPTPQVPIIQRPHQPTCKESCCKCLTGCQNWFSGLFCCCKPSPNMNIGQQKVGRCCLPCFQPEICGQCIYKLCQQCRNGLCLKFSMCSNCKTMLCANCRKSVFCVSQPKIRDYPIRIKDRHGLHFQNCQCNTCFELTQKLLSQGQNLIQRGFSHQSLQGPNNLPPNMNNTNMPQPNMPQPNMPQPNMPQSNMPSSNVFPYSPNQPHQMLLDNIISQVTNPNSRR